MKEPKPKVDVKKAAEECKKYLDFKKLDLVDFGLANIECYVPPKDDDYPELKEFAKQWKSFFNYAETLVIGDRGEGFPNDLAKEFEDKNMEIEKLVNSDSKYWDNIRSTIIPLYERSPVFSDWQKRWNSIMFFYDPIEMNAKVEKAHKDPETGEVVKTEVVSETLYPESFVIRIDGREDFGCSPSKDECQKLPSGLKTAIKN
jgi:hypothetical protein